MWACQNGHMDTVRVLLDAGAQVDLQDKAGASALMWAARAAQTKIALALIAAKGSVGLKDACGHTALARAAKIGHSHFVSEVNKYLEGQP